MKQYNLCIFRWSRPQKSENGKLTGGFTRYASRCTDRNYDQYCGWCQLDPYDLDDNSSAANQHPFRPVSSRECTALRVCGRNSFGSSSLDRRQRLVRCQREIENRGARFIFPPYFLVSTNRKEFYGNLE